ncbi:MAG: transaldolase family protein [Erysipelotrichaceae bacterium]|nr:transaldolase family protein [Erysipelotrichaceae bacterium]
MKLLIDCADIEQIKTMYEWYPLEGVTCNPTILKRAGRPPYEALTDIRNFIGDQGDLHVQMVSSTVEGMIAEAQYVLTRLGKTTYIKIPVDNIGLMAIRRLHAMGIRVTATAIYHPMQAFLAAQAGADYAAPYVNRIEVLSGNGVETACLIEDIFQKNKLSCHVLGASFKRIDQVQSLINNGLYSATLSADLLKSLLVSADTDKAIHDFAADFYELCGPNKTMLNCDGEKA